MLPAPAAVVVALVAALAHGASACQTDDDCLLLGSCDAGACKCRQGFTGPECGQLDLAAAPATLGYRNLSASTWGGLPLNVRGKWHMYVSMMAGDCPLGTFNNNSFIAHLAGDSWGGPYQFVSTVTGPFAHNAAPRLLPDGSVAVWYIGYDGVVDPISCPKGVPPENFVWPDWTGKQIAMARSPPGKPDGPWTIQWLFDLPKLPQDWWHWDCGATNPSAVISADGSVQMLYRGTMCTHCDGCPHPKNASERLGIATAPSVEGPYTRAATYLNLGNKNSVEDPYYWRGTSGSHHLIAHSGTVCKDEFPGGGNWCGVIASSSDGVSWRLARERAYGPNVTLENGTVLQLFARQRPQLLFDTPPPPGASGGASGGTSGGASGGASGSASGGASGGASEPRLLALVNGAELAEGGSGGGLMARTSFTLIQPVAAPPPPSTYSATKFL
jgi:hypothetical protein